jgi:hypothetical protein
VEDQMAATAVVKVTVDIVEANAIPKVLDVSMGDTDGLGTEVDGHGREEGPLDGRAEARVQCAEFLNDRQMEPGLLRKPSRKSPWFRASQHHGGIKSHGLTFYISHDLAQVVVLEEGVNLWPQVTKSLRSL